MPRIAAVICSHNRADYLRKALLSLLDQSLPETDYEIVVVDNASTDATAGVVQQVAAKAGNVSYVHEPCLGLSHARNTGARACSSPFIAYLDDDAAASPVWLEEILSAFKEHHSRPGCVGGRVLLNWKDGAPAWLPRKYWSLYTFLDYGETTRELRGKEYLVGANFAVERSLLLSVSGFRTDLGRHGSSLLSGEEAALLEEVKSLGRPIVYSGKALVWHAVDSVRLRRMWFFKRVFWDGASQPIMSFVDNCPRSYYARRVASELRHVAALGVGLPLTLLGARRSPYPERFLAILQRLGRVRTYLQLFAVPMRSS
jgi:glycosyltransferase involved in cell wall biosynthesis